MSAAFGTQAFQQSRHARRIYVGGFPPNYGDEEALKFFLNSVIAKGLGEPNDNSYVLSIYVNQKKCFAFVELRAIELATACLDLDGIIYKKVVLKVLRANEYKPELIPPSMVGAPITLDLSSFSFGIPAVTTGPGAEKTSSGGPGGSNGLAASSSDNHDDARMDSVIQFASLGHVSAGCISIIGYPFDDRAAHSYSNAPQPGNKDPSGAATSPHNPTSERGGGGGVIAHSSSTGNANTGSASTGSGSGGFTGLGCTQAPKKMRNLIRKYKFGLTQNPEYQVDLTRLKYIDLGDVQVGKTREETKLNLSSIVGDVVQRRAVPFVIGGSSDCGYFNALGVMAATEVRVGMVVISAQIDDTRVLDDGRLCPLVSSVTSPIQVPTTTTADASNLMKIDLPHLSTLGSHSGSYMSLLSDPGLHTDKPGQLGSELDSTGAPIEKVSKPHCGGRYVRFAAQGSQVNKVQSAHVLDRGGHIVWLSKDIRNQSPACSLLAAPDCSIDDQAKELAHTTPGAIAVPHLYTRKLFQHALRCAAGIPLTITTAAATAVAPSVEVFPQKEDPTLAEAVKSMGIHRQDSQDTCDTTTPHHADLQVDPISPSPSSGCASTPSHGAVSSTAVASSATTDAAGTPVLAAPATTGPHSGGGEGDAKNDPGAVVVSIDMGVMSSAVRGCGYITGSSSSTTGLTVDEILDIVMMAGADPNVVSLDISEFSPDAEDTRSNMLLAQMFYQFSMGVASRPASGDGAGAGQAFHAAKIDRRGAVNAGVEVDASSSSFILTDSSYLARIHTEQKDMSSASRTPKYYQEVSSSSMEGHISGQSGNNSVTGDSHSTHTASASVSTKQPPFVEVEHRLSSMDAFDCPTSGEFTYTRSGGSGSNSVSSKQGGLSPTVQMGTIASNSGNISTSLDKPLYPQSVLAGHVLNQRVNFPTALDTNLGGANVPMSRTSPNSSTAAANARRFGVQGTSPPITQRTINPGKAPTAAGMNVSQLYPASAQMQHQQVQRNLGTSASHLSSQHQQMLAQQQAAQVHHMQQQQQLQQQPVYGQRAPQQYRGSVPQQQSPVYPPQQQAHSPQYGRDPLSYQFQQQQQQQQQQRMRYEGDPQVEHEHARHGVPSSVGVGGWNQQQQGVDRSAETNRYHSAQGPPPPGQHHRQAPQQMQHQQQQHLQQHQLSAYRPSPNAHTQLESTPGTASYLSADFLDITGERIPGAAGGRVDGSGGGYMDRHLNRLVGNTTNADLNLSLSLGINTDLSLSAGGGSASDKSRSLIRNNSNLATDIHSFDESLDLYDYRLSGGSANSGSGGGVSQTQQQQRQQQQALGGATRNIGQPPPIPQYQQQQQQPHGSLNRPGGYPGGNNNLNIYSLYGNSGPAPLSSDSLAFSSTAGGTNANSSMNSDIMSSLAGLASNSGSISTSSMLFGSPSPLGQGAPSHLQGNPASAPSNQAGGGRPDTGDSSSDFLQDHYSQFSVL